MMFVCDKDGVPFYIVCNDAGLCLIATSNGAIANFVESHVKGLPPNMRLNVGGDPGTKKERKIWHHVNRYRR